MKLQRVGDDAVHRPGVEERAEPAIVVDQLEPCTGKTGAREALEMSAAIDGDVHRRRRTAPADEDGLVARDRAGEPSLEQPIRAHRDAAHHHVHLVVLQRGLDVGPPQRHQHETAAPVVRPGARHLDVEAAPAGRRVLGERRVVAGRAHAYARACRP